jgi:hypothetical protein
MTCARIRGGKSVRLIGSRQPAGIRQERIALESGRTYDGSVWIKIESGAPRMSLRVLAKAGRTEYRLPPRSDDRAATVYGCGDRDTGAVELLEGTT